MKVVFISNYLSIHQLPFCDEMYNLLGDNFTFISTKPINETRQKLFGWELSAREYEEHTEIATCSDNEMKVLKQQLLDADILILGHIDNSFFKERLCLGKVTFKFSERFFKRGLGGKNYIKSALSMWKNFGIYRKKPLYVLCASAYTAADMNRFFSFGNKCFKWGYFPEVKEYDIDSLLENKNKNEIMWAGRFLDWKHPEEAVYLAKRLKEDGYDFTLNIIGGGDMDEEIKKIVERENVSDCVNLLGTKKPEEVRAYMEKASIYLFTSDFTEGWGAVLNEAMNSACACVASHAIGSAPFLVNDGVNAFLYKNQDKDDLYNKVKFLLDNPDKTKEFGKNAYLTMSEMWNEKVAAKRLVELFSKITKGEDVVGMFNDGPLSMAENLDNNWM